MQVSQLVNLTANALVVEEKVVVPVEEVPVAEPAGVISGYKILVIDDEPDFVAFATAILQDNGAVTLKAFDGDEAIGLARNEKPDLITLDLSMPGKSGIEVFESMRQDPELQSIPVCIISGRPELRKLIYDREFRPPEGFVDKPITEENLLLNIRKILDLHHKERTAAG
jgi:CheY-like chemotaxis protein